MLSHLYRHLFSAEHRNVFCAIGVLRNNETLCYWCPAEQWNLLCQLRPTKKKNETLCHCCKLLEGLYTRLCWCALLMILTNLRYVTKQHACVSTVWISYHNVSSTSLPIGLRKRMWRIRRQIKIAHYEQHSLYCDFLFCRLYLQTPRLRRGIVSRFKTSAYFKQSQIFLQDTASEFGQICRRQCVYSNSIYM